MVKINPELIRELITDSGKLFVPSQITNSISKSTISDADAMSSEYTDKLKPAYDEQSKKNAPITIDYSSEMTIDAYSAYYLPRNTLIPKTAILCSSYHKNFQSLPDKLRILDVGSGSGAVVLGMIDLFANKVFSNVNLDFVSLDHSIQSLLRQQKLIENMNRYRGSHIWYPADLSDPNDYQYKIEKGAPYNMIFAANILSELEASAAITLVENIARVLAPNGIVVNVESQSNFAKAQRIRVIRKASDVGLHMYYPCPPNLSCTKRDCWMWRTDEFECPDIMIRGQALETVKKQTAHWIIFSNNPASIYDVFHQKNPDLTWGVAAPIKHEVDGGKIKYNYEFCTEGGRLTGTTTQDALKWAFSFAGEPFGRGTIIGITKSSQEIKEGWDIIRGFYDF